MAAVRFRWATWGLCFIEVDGVRTPLASKPAWLPYDCFRAEAATYMEHFVSEVHIEGDWPYRGMTIEERAALQKLTQPHEVHHTGD